MSEAHEAAVLALRNAGLVADVTEGRVVIRGGRRVSDLDGLRVYHSPFLILEEVGVHRAHIAWIGEAVRENVGGLDFLVRWICKQYETKG